MTTNWRSQAVLLAALLVWGCGGSDEAGAPATDEAGNLDAQAGTELGGTTATDLAPVDSAPPAGEPAAPATELASAESAPPEAEQTSEDAPIEESPPQLDLSGLDAAGLLALLKEHPEDPQILAALAQTHWDAGSEAEGTKYAQRWVAADPESAFAHYMAGIMLEGTSEPVEAAEHYQSAVALDPTDLNVHRQWASMSPDPAATAKAYESLAKQWPSSPWVQYYRWHHRSNLDDAAGDEPARAKAQSLLEKELQANPDCVDCSWMVGMLYSGAENWAQARKPLEVAAAALPEAPEIRIQLITALIELDENEAAETHLRVLLKAGSNSEHAYLTLEQLLEEEKDKKGLAQLRADYPDLATGLPQEDEEE